MPGFFNPDPQNLRLVDSGSRGGRGGLFNRYLAGSSAFGALAPAAQSVVAQRFDPLSALYALNAAAQPENLAPQDFRQFLTTNPATPTRANLTSLINQVRPFFGGGVLTPAQEAARDSLQDEAVASNIITQALTSGVNPLLRRFAENAAARRIAAFRDQDPSTGLFSRLLAGGFGAGL